jgi:hypothetical protein
VNQTDHAECRARILVRVRAGARRDEVAGVVEGAVVVFVSAPAHDGRANRATLRLLAKRLGVARSRLRILRGERSRDKLVEVVGIEQRTADAALRLNDGSAAALMQ